MPLDLSDPRVTTTLTLIFNLVDDYYVGKIDEDTLFTKAGEAIKRLIITIESKEND